MSDHTVTSDDLSAEQQMRLQHAIQSLADSKRLMGIRYSDWLLGAPSIEAGVAASSMCQDEWGHARLLYAMLKPFGVSPEQVEHDRPADEYASMDPLDAQFEDWAAVVAGIVVVDGAISSALAGFAEGAYTPARSRAPKMLVEEEFHRDLGEAWFRRLADGSSEGQERLALASRSFLPRALAWLTPADEGFGELVAAGIFEDGARARHRFEEATSSFLGLVGIELASVEADRTDWDPVRGRGPGAPDEEAVSRARGDLNRMLFVE